MKTNGKQGNHQYEMVEIIIHMKKLWCCFVCLYQIIHKIKDDRKKTSMLFLTLEQEVPNNQ